MQTDTLQELLTPNPDIVRLPAEDLTPVIRVHEDGESCGAGWCDKAHCFEA